MWDPGWVCQSTSGRPLPQSNKWDHSFEEMLRLIHYQYLKNHPDPRRAKQVLKWVQTTLPEVSRGLERHPFVQMQPAQNTHKIHDFPSCQWFYGVTAQSSGTLTALLHWALRNGTFISAQAGGQGALFVPAAVPRPANREGGRINICCSTGAAESRVENPAQAVFIRV